MIKIRKSEERGHLNHGWLDTYHTFSFADYHDPKFVHFRALRVLNEDRVDGGKGFGAHPHRDMEIITYVLEGALTHEDSMGNGSTINPGDVQYMCAGTGVVHSEFNHSDSPVHLIQIWIIPPAKNLPPSYDQKNFTTESRSGRLKLVASPGGVDDSISIHQDVKLYASILNSGESVELQPEKGRGQWLQVVKGQVALNAAVLSRGDGAAVTDEASLKIVAKAPDSEFLLFDLD